MNILLLEARDPERPAPPFLAAGLAYLASWLERYGSEPHQVLIATGLDEVGDFSPDLLGISAVSPNFPQAIRLAQTARQRWPVPLVLGGPHITAFPQSLPAPFCAGVIGEGEATFAHIVSEFARQHKLSPESLATIPGLVYHTPQGPALTPPRPLIADLDSIPFPLSGFRLTDESSESMPQWSFSSRGCPYRCRFCSTASFWHSYRVHSARYVVEEYAQHVVRSQLPLHIFMDDLFAANLSRLKEISRLLAESGLPRQDMVATIRADLVTEDTAKVLREIGVSYCHLGLESGSDQVLAYLKNQTTTVHDNQRALDILAAHGLQAAGSFIIGAPNEEENDIAATYAFISRNLECGKLASFSFGPLVAFPGTAVWDYATAQGRLNPAQLDWRTLDIDVRSFNLEHYIQLSPLSRDSFAHWFRKMLDLWHTTTAT